MKKEFWEIKCMKLMSKFLLVFLVGFMFSLTGVLAAIVPISTCGDPSGGWQAGNTYVLQNNVSIYEVYPASHICFSIGANNIILDCAGYRIGGRGRSVIPPGSNEFGIYLNGRTGVTIKNCIVDNFERGVYLVSSSNNNIINIISTSHGDHGIFLSSSPSNNITNSIAIGNYGNGIYLVSSSNSNIINSTTNSNGRGINIESSSNVNVINCTVHGHTTWCYGGIQLSGVTNSNIIGNNASENCMGISLGGSSNNRLTNNIANWCNSGFSLYNSPSNTLINNIANFNGGSSGIALHGSNSNYNALINNTVSSNVYGISIGCSNCGLHDTDVINNTITFNNQYGIWLQETSNIRVIGNNMRFNRFSGIWSRSSYSNKIMNNIASSNGGSGIDVLQEGTACSGTTVANNIADYNSGHGIALGRSRCDVVVNNTITSNAASGIGAWDSAYANVANNTANSNKQAGILFESSAFTNITNNIVSFNKNGVQLVNNPNTKITNTVALFNTNNGILLNSSSFCQVTNVTANTITRGIYLFSSSNVTLSRDTVTDYCGDGATDASKGEECDSPQAICEPAYNGQCTYCDLTCKNVTIQAYCGDGKCQTDDENAASCPQDCVYAPGMKNIVSYWKFNEGGGQIIGDSADGNNGIYKCPGACASLQDWNSCQNTGGCQWIETGYCSQIGPDCYTYTNQSSCMAAGCEYWWAECYGPEENNCSGYTDQNLCMAAGCNWWGDCYGYSCSDYTDSNQCSQAQGRCQWNWLQYCNGTPSICPMPWTTGKAGNALRFNINNYIFGPTQIFSSNYVEIGKNTSIPSGNNPWSIEAWINNAGSNDYQTIIGITPVAGDTLRTIQFQIKPNGNLYMYHWSYERDTGANVPINTWHHAAATYDGTMERIYLDGTEIDSWAPGTLRIFPERVWIGESAAIAQGSNGNPFNGTIDEVAIYNQTLSAYEIRQHYERGLKGKSYDETGINCFDGTLLGSCSMSKPHYCANISGIPTLTSNCSSCGCPLNGKCRQDGTCIFLGDGVELDSSSNSNLTLNIIMKCGNGIYIKNSTDNLIFKNNIYNNTIKQINFSTCPSPGTNLSTLFGGGNYWGHTTPPYFISDVDTNCPGLIDSMAYNALNAWLLLGIDITISQGWNLFSPTLEPTDNLTNRNISLKKGWNIFGYSSYEPFEWNTTLVNNGTATKTILEASSPQYNWTQLTIYYYENSTYKFIPGDDDYLRQNRGYWLFAFKDNLTLTLPNVGGSLQGNSYRWVNANVSNGIETKTIEQANSLGWLQSTIYYFNENKQYYGFVPDDNDYIYPWRGYWLYSNLNNLTLEFP